MKLTIKYGVDYELKRVMQTLNKLEWYLNNGYKPRLPQKTTKESTEKEIFAMIKSEYENNDYKLASKKIKTEFSKIKKDFFNKLKDRFKDEIPTSIDIILTKYGAGGSYQTPKTIIVNINQKEILEVTLHEIVHLFAEPIVHKQKMTHWEKEAFVKSILAEIYKKNI